MIFNPWDQIFKFGVPDDLKEPAPIFDKFLEILIEKYSSKNIEILDVACGGGRHSIELAKKGYAVSAFDLSSTGISILLQEIMKNNIESLEVTKADMFETYPYNNEAFHAVLAVQAIYHGTPDNMKKAISEIARVLKKNGVFFFTVSTEIERSMLGANRILYKKIGEKVYLPLVGREMGLIHYYPNQDDIRYILNDCFTNVKINENIGLGYIVVSCQKK